MCVSKSYNKCNGQILSPQRVWNDGASSRRFDRKRSLNLNRHPFMLVGQIWDGDRGERLDRKSFNGPRWGKHEEGMSEVRGGVLL